MIAPTTPLLYLLDTNVLVHLVREDAVSRRLLHRYELFHRQPRPLLCEVNHGELRSLALQFDWGLRRVTSALELLDYFVTVPISTTRVYQTYSEIDRYCIAQGRALGDNDVWIAAATEVSAARLLTTDRDFDPLHHVFFHREWIDPHLDARA